MGLNEKEDSSLGTAISSQSNTSGSVPVERINLVRESNVVQKEIEC